MRKETKKSLSLTELGKKAYENKSFFWGKGLIIAKQKYKTGWCIFDHHTANSKYFAKNYNEAIKRINYDINN